MCESVYKELNKVSWTSSSWFLKTFHLSSERPLHFWTRFWFSCAGLSCIKVHYIRQHSVCVCPLGEAVSAWGCPWVWSVWRRSFLTVCLHLFFCSNSVVWFEELCRCVGASFAFPQPLKGHSRPDDVVSNSFCWDYGLFSHLTTSKLQFSQKLRWLRESQHGQRRRTAHQGWYPGVSQREHFWTSEVEHHLPDDGVHQRISAAAEVSWQTLRFRTSGSVSLHPPSDSDPLDERRSNWNDLKLCYFMVVTLSCRASGKPEFKGVHFSVSFQSDWKWSTLTTGLLDVRVSTAGRIKAVTDSPLKWSAVIP